jgi:hypothetical protein
VAFVTCAELPKLDSEDLPLVAAVRERGIEVDAVVWDDPAVDWERYDLSVLRSPWDYPSRRDEFLRWADSVPRLANSASLVRWNTEKTYLRELAAAGVPVTPTLWLEPGGIEADGVDDLDERLPAKGAHVVKPAVGAGSKDAGRYELGDAEQRGLALAHARRLLAADRIVMVQPYLAAVDTVGESGLVHFGGVFSHAIRKGAMLEGPDTGVVELYKYERISALTPAPDELEVARRVLAAVPGEPPLYARVDLIRDEYGEPILLELELTEPSLFFTRAEGAADRLANLIKARIAER